MELKEVVSESGHWYKFGGEPCYTVIGKNGKERSATLRDARTMNLVPSVTTIMKVAAAPGLQKWIIDQHLDAALTLPEIEGESLDDRKLRIIIDAKAQSKKAMELGTSIHGSLEKAYGFAPYPIEHLPHVKATILAIEEHFGPREWSSEKSFAHEYGFGGKIDLSAENLVIDFKTSAFGPDDKKSGYDEHRMQLAAYATGLGFEDYRAANVFVSTTHPGLVRIVEWTKEELSNGWSMFKALLDFWQIKNQYVPEQWKEAA